MSYGRARRAIGTLAGGGFALARAQQQPPEHLLWRSSAGCAGNLGARPPDAFDPATHPGAHRSLAHGIAPVAAVRRVAVRGLDGAQAQVRVRAGADRRSALRASAITPLQRLWQAVPEILCRLRAGALAGLLGGYGPHLALYSFTPAGTPAGLPILA